ncbi:MAG: hypothetical protein ACP5JG_04650 [Anaerolineae bacterium]
MSEKVQFEEEFEQRMDADWKWLREAPEAWRIGEDGLEMRTLPGSLWGESNNARNVLLRPAQPAVPGLSSEVTVHNQPVLQGEQAGLIWYQDDANYIKLVKESLDGAIWIVMAREEGDQPELVDKVAILPETAHLQLSLEDGKMVGRFRTPDDKAWAEVATCDPLPDGPVQLGIFTHGGAANADRWVTLSSFRITTQGG